MIVCPNCSHQNPEAAVQCEACYTPLPAMTSCPSCGAAVQTDASFCGQCGFNIQAASATSNPVGEPSLVAATPSFEPGFEAGFEPVNLAELSIPPLALSMQPEASQPQASQPEPPQINPPDPPEASPEVALSMEPDLSPVAPAAAPMSSSNSQTQLQTQSAQLLHVQTNTLVELPSTLAVIHLGKPNDRIPPDVDVSGYPHSEIVSRIHADIRVEGDIYYIEDVGSSNGTYINNAPLPSGNRHRLRPGDRIALGKGDKVTFLFQMS